MRLNELISNVNVYGIEESIIASGYPMVTNPSESKLCMSRAKTLGNALIGSGHDNFLNGIVVQFDLDFTIKAWTEAERYHFLEFVSSCSTMHKLKDMDFNLCYIEHVDDRIIKVMRELQQAYNNNKTQENFLNLIYSNPVGMKLTARMTTNYRQLKTIYTQRKVHELPEWKALCKWVELLPYAKELGIVGKALDNTLLPKEK